MAALAIGSEDRTRQALYAAIGRAWDFALAAEAEPDDFAQLVAEAGLALQARAPLIPVVKLVFGAQYDKTRLTEYATALAHAHRLGLSRGELAGFLGETPGGLKGVVAAERGCAAARKARPGSTRAPPWKPACARCPPARWTTFRRRAASFRWSWSGACPMAAWPCWAKCWTTSPCSNAPRAA
jgi:hypothetical protein